MTRRRLPNWSGHPPREFEFCNDREYSVSRFLGMFDSIFNLNQDLLLDMRYSIQILTASGARWIGFEPPKSFDRTKWLSLSDDKSAELRELLPAEMQEKK